MFRYPGGKSWLLPEIRQWFIRHPSRELLEPFAGGASVSLAAVMEGLVERVTLVELDSNVSAVWRVILGPASSALCDRIASFDITREHVAATLAHPPTTDLERAFQILLRNRTSHGGNLAPGAGIMRSGERGGGIGSRWYTATLCNRVQAIAEHRDRIDFIEGDGFDAINAARDRPDVALFIDPPYMTAGRRLYAHHAVDPSRLFDALAGLQSRFLLTYDDTEQIRELTTRHGFAVQPVTMRTTRNATKFELIITPRPTTPPIDHDNQPFPNQLRR